MKAVITCLVLTFLVLLPNLTSADDYIEIDWTNGAFCIMYERMAENGLYWEADVSTQGWAELYLLQVIPYGMVGGAIQTSDFFKSLQVAPWVSMSFDKGKIELATVNLYYTGDKFYFGRHSALVKIMGRKLGLQTEGGYSQKDGFSFCTGPGIHIPWGNGKLKTFLGFRGKKRKLRIRYSFQI